MSGEKSSSCILSPSSSSSSIRDDILALVPYDYIVKEQQYNDPRAVAEAVQELWHSEQAHARRYVQAFLKQYTQWMAQNQNNISEDEDDTFDTDSDETIWNLLQQSVQTSVPPPSPDDSCVVSFFNNSNNNSSTALDSSTVTPLRIRVYPYHNDVALRIWEAGAALGDYLIHDPTDLGRHVLEVGAGTGLTGLVAAGLLLQNGTNNTTNDGDTADGNENDEIPRRPTVTLTDASSMALINMQYNCELNRTWLSAVAKNTEPEVSCAYFNWDDDDDDDGVNIRINDNKDIVDSDNDILLQRADTLLAADVLYDPNSIPALVRTVRRFFFVQLQPDAADHPKKTALFATMPRNQATFQLWQEQLAQHGLIATLLVGGGGGDNGNAAAWEAIPVRIPLGGRPQPRSNVRIYRLTLRENETES